MADITWTGQATAVAQVDSITPANVEVGDIFTITITDPDGTSCAISYTAAAATVADVTAGLAAAWNASTNTLCTAITASDETTYVKLTADTAGEAFIVAATESNGGATDDQTLTRAAVTASAGPKHWDSADNWSGGAVPGGAAAQNVYIANASDTIKYGLDQSGISNALASLHIDQSFTGTIGVAGDSGEAGTYLQIKATTIFVGEHAGPGSPSGSGHIMIDAGSTASVITIVNAGTPTTSTTPAILLLADSASTTITCRKGKVGVAYQAGETSTVGTITTAYTSNVNSDADVYIGSGVTLTTLNCPGGDTVLGCGVTTATIDAGTLTTSGSGAITTLYANGGTVTANSTGTITTAEIKDDTTLDLTKSTVARTITTTKIDAGGVIKYDPAYVTLTNKIQPISTSGIITYTAS